VANVDPDRDRRRAEYRRREHARIVDRFDRFLRETYANPEVDPNLIYNALFNGVSPTLFCSEHLSWACQHNVSDTPVTDAYVRSRMWDAAVCPEARIGDHDCATHGHVHEASQSQHKSHYGASDLPADAGDWCDCTGQTPTRMHPRGITGCVHGRCPDAEAHAEGAHDV